MGTATKVARARRAGVERRAKVRAVARARRAGVRLRARLRAAWTAPRIAAAKRRRGVGQQKGKRLAGWIPRGTANRPPKIALSVCSTSAMLQGGVWAASGVGAAHTIWPVPGEKPFAGRGQREEWEPPGAPNSLIRQETYQATFAVPKDSDVLDRAFVGEGSQQNETTGRDG